MAFTNLEVDLSSLPVAESVPLQPIHLSYLKLLRIEWLITTAFLLVVSAALIIFIPGIRSNYYWLIIVIISLFIIFSSLIIQEKSFPFKQYAVREKDVIYQKGWLIRTTKICPFNRIQNCSVHTGPLERKFNLATLKLYTAGSEGADLSIPGLTADEADTLRHFILDKINVEKADGN